MEKQDHKMKKLTYLKIPKGREVFELVTHGNSGGIVPKEHKKKIMYQVYKR
jgi:hypothetical protein